MKEVPQNLGLDKKSSSKSTDLQSALLSLKMTTVQVVKTPPTKSLPMALLTHNQISSFKINAEDYFSFITFPKMRNGPSSQLHMFQDRQLIVIYGMDQLESRSMGRKLDSEQKL